MSNQSSQQNNYDAVAPKVPYVPGQGALKEFTTASSKDIEATSSARKNVTQGSITPAGSDLSTASSNGGFIRMLKSKKLKSDEYVPAVSFMALTIITIIRIATQWQQKSIGYFYGFQGTGELAGSPKYEISTAYPELDTYYGLLVGLAYTLPYSISGLYAGSLTRTYNRRAMMIGVITALSLFQISTGLFDSFLVLAIFRFLHGTISSAINPLAFSLVSDYFPANKRSTANAILSSANFVGIALSSMTILLIKNIGWR